MMSGFVRSFSCKSYVEYVYNIMAKSAGIDIIQPNILSQWIGQFLGMKCENPVKLEIQASM